MTTAPRVTTQRAMYRLSALTTTAVTVVPSARAFATAAAQTSSGMRSERGMVATSAPPDDLAVNVTEQSPVVLEARDAAVGGLMDALDESVVPNRVGQRLGSVLVRPVSADLGEVHQILLLSGCVDTSCTPTYLHVNHIRSAAA